MKRLTYSICLLIISIIGLQAQNNADAERIIDNILNQVRTSAISTAFTLKVSEKNAVNSQSGSGTFIMKGSKFVLEMDNMKAWFDGKTQWAYLAESNEVSITEPTESELADTNPMAILSKYRSKCVIRFSKTKLTQNNVVEMLPKDKKSEIVRIEIQSAKSTGHPVSIKMVAKNGTTTLLTLSNYQKNMKVSDDIFVFNKAKYKGVTMNDLR